MKVTVRDNYLNVRVGKPSVNAPCYQYLAPGSILEVDGKLYKGDKFGDSGIDTWLKDEADNYYWSGGVQLPVLNLGKLTSPCDYNFLLQNIDPAIKANGGKNIVIAVLDTGCFEKHEALTGSVSQTYNAIDKSKDITDHVGHGTFVAGIIAGRNESLRGIAFRSELIIVKISDSFNGVSATAINEALRWLISDCPMKPDIINISLQFSPGALRSDLTAKFKQLRESGTLIYAAAEDDNNLANPSVLYPASDENVTGVGGLELSSDLVTNNQFSKINSKIKYIVPNLTFLSSNNTIVPLYCNDTGSSFCTAIVTGATAILKASGGNIIESVSKAAIPISKLSFNNNLIIFKTA